MIAYINYPSWLTPEVFGFLNLPPNSFLNIFRWYSLAYIIGIIISFYQARYLLKTDKFETLNNKIIEDYYFWGILGIFFGGRIFSCLVYNFSYYSNHLFEIIWPFRDGHFVGFAGMAYHGAAIGVFLASIIFVKVKKINFRELCDLVFPVIPLGYTLGRIANFTNQELWGKVTGSSIGILFPLANKVPIKLNYVQEIINKLGWKIDLTTNMVTDKLGRSFENLVGYVIDNNGNMTGIPGINLPRHPSQLYEAFFEGIVLFFIIWFIGRKFKPFKGFLAPLYLIGYSIFRFFLEFFREPDNEFANILAGKYTGYVLANLSMGQILSIITLIFGIGLGIYFYFLSKKEKD